MTIDEAIKYAKGVYFCTGCTSPQFAEDAEYICKSCEHFQFFEIVIDALERCKRIDEADYRYEDSHTENYRLGWNDCLEFAKGE